MASQRITFEKVSRKPTEKGRILRQNIKVSSAQEFEDFARTVMSNYYDKYLSPGQIPGVPKLFDFVSDDRKIVGDAKYYTLVRGRSAPPAKFATIAEHVWLLEKLDSVKRFLVFGNDRRVPEEWLRRYGSLIKDISFFFLNAKSGELVELSIGNKSYRRGAEV